MKNVGLLISTLNCGGAERVVSRLSSLLSENYNIYIILFEDTYLCYKYEGSLINLNIKSENYSILKKIFLPIKRAKKLKSIKKEFNLDVVISFLDSPNIVNILSKYKGCKTVVSVRNYSKREKELSTYTKIVNFFISKLYKKADKIIAVSKVIRNSLINDYKLDSRNIEVIYNPYDLNEICDLASEEIDNKYKKFIAGEKIFISVGRQMYQKGFWHLVKAFNILNKIDPETRLIIVGKDFQGGAVKQLVNDLELKDKVLLTGYQENPFKYINVSACYVLTSMFEGFPNSMVEALACGCPVIAADCKSGPREILYKNSDINKEAIDMEIADYGILIPELDKNENWQSEIYDEKEELLANAMLKIINDKYLRERLSKKSVKRAKDFNFELCKKKYIEVIEDV